MLELTRSRVNGCTSCYPYSIALRYAPRNDRLFTENYKSQQILVFVKISIALIIRLSCTGVKIHLNKKFDIQPIRQAKGDDSVNDRRECSRPQLGVGPFNLGVWAYGLLKPMTARLAFAILAILAILPKQSQILEYSRWGGYAR